MLTIFPAAAFPRGKEEHRLSPVKSVYYKEKMRPVLFSLILLSIGTSLHAQTQEDAIKATIQRLFTAMLHADSAGIAGCFAPGAQLQSVTEDKAGNETVHTMPVTEFASHIAKLPANAADERIVFGSLLLDGRLASVWVPYRFYFKGQFSHCGVDSFQMVKFPDGWKIQYLIDTRRKDSCEEAAAK
ncbi:nuclear transport factor 2 family protein [Chitinophaga polysaccharea]|uniref:nuclear transport factor 2 family protein n=1 Tax=Chitinophaga polysaccharea TaxID=1293035 RepID=UPI0021AEE629|nr:nuclear transport factor 2 family protein [Chitinophaga polysaccharea]